MLVKSEGLGDDPNPSDDAAAQPRGSPLMSPVAVDVPTKKGEKTNERPGTRAQAKFIRMSASKARVVLDLIRNRDVRTADEILQFSERDAAIVIRKLLRSAVANAEHNDSQAADDLYVSACYADEGKTIRRFRPRARGRATRIRKRSCHITVIVSRMPDELLERRRAKDATRPGRAARVRGQQAAEEVTRRRRRRRSGGGGAGAAAEEQGIVDQQAPAVDAVEELEDEETAVAETEGPADEAGIVDQQEAAVEAVEGVDDVEGASGSAESELAAQDDDEERK